MPTASYDVTAAVLELTLADGKKVRLAAVAEGPDSLRNRLTVTVAERFSGGDLPLDERLGMVGMLAQPRVVGYDWTVSTDRFSYQDVTADGD